ncbi:MAG: amino acid adenylation domain-containing protein [Pseudomonas sp.]|uniref:amino acid adenylation domain-containing protein n=1 Tax=Pseudomonas sp. TaxID=306 RepID=UPI0030F322F2
MSTSDTSLARRFIELPAEKRRLFLAALQAEQIDFAQYPIVPVPGHADRDQLSYAQQRMWFLWQLEPHSAAYNLPSAVRLLGPLNCHALEQSFQALVQRHESLRTTFVQRGEQGWQQVAERATLPVQFTDLSALANSEKQQQTQHHVAQQAAQPFDLQTGPLLRVQVLRLAAEEHVLLLTMHHIIADGWSMNILIQEFMAGYDAFAAGQPLHLPALTAQYRDYGLWQRSWLEAGERERQLAYWRTHLGDEHPLLELPTDHPRPALPSHAGARLEFSLEAGLQQALKALAKRSGVTLFVVLLASFKVLLHRYSGQGDIRVGGLIANRTRSESEGLIGFFVNTQVLRSQLSGELPFSRLLEQVKQATTGAQAHQELPFDAVLEALQPSRSQSHNPLFQVMFNHQPLVTDVSEMQLAGGLRVAHLEAGQGAGGARQHAAASDLMLETREEGEQLLAAITYATDLFEATTIERLASHWRHLLQAITEAPEQPIGSLPLLRAAEQQRQHANNAYQQLPAVEPPVQQLFEHQVERTPNAVAVQLAGSQQSLSYRELNSRANRLAWRLNEMGIGHGSLVAVLLGRDLSLPVALLAVLKSGAAYVPLDPNQSAERLAKVCAASGVQLLLCQGASLPDLAGIASLCVEQESDWLEGYSDSNLNLAVHPEQLAYVIYTSGSTGQPKGVAISHGALAGFSQLAAEYSELQPSDRVLQFATASFDGFVEQFYPPLIRGAAVVLRDARTWDSETWLLAVQQHGITLADLPAAYWHMLVKDFAQGAPRDFAQLRQIHVGGEAMAVEGLQLSQRAGLGAVRLLNTYGPTEATVVSSIYDCTGLRTEQVSWRGIAIGRPLPGTRLYVLDGELNLLPQGAIGELYIGGPGLARGYHGQPALTAERFVADPFNPGQRLYRSGDRVRCRADGALEYIGRVDHQVKIRGFRIELGEVEARLQQCAGVREALVVAADLGSGATLVAYIVPEQAGLALADASAQQPFRQQLRASLQANLADYMVPSHLLLLAKMPLTSSGKLDRKALPKPDPTQLQSHYRAPHSELEIALAGIWMEVLQVPRIGLDDSFFDLGGHSLLAAQVVARIKRELGLSLPLRSLFERPLLADLAAELASQQSHGAADWDEMEAFINELEEV